MPDTSAARALALIEIARPPAAVWAVMLDCDRTLKFIARLRACRVTAADPAGRWDVREHVVDWLWPLPSVRSVFRSEYEPFTLIRFRRIEGTLKSLEGSWRLQPIREGRATRLTYEAHIDPGLPVPGVLMRSAIENELRDTLAGLRRETLRGG